MRMATRKTTAEAGESADMNRHEFGSGAKMARAHTSCWPTKAEETIARLTSANAMTATQPTRPETGTRVEVSSAHIAAAAAAEEEILTLCRSNYLHSPIEEWESRD